MMEVQVKKKWKTKVCMCVHVSNFHLSSTGRYFEGQLIPAGQPKLITGGIMRSYQLEGMEWLKVK